MKRFLFMLLLVSFAVGASAQWRIGYARRDFEGNRKGEEVYYKQKGKGKITLICMPDKAYYDCGTFPADYVEFSGYYIGEVTDPVDNYVNIRKGPGTQYPVVDRIDTNYLIIFKYTNTNWLEVYVDDEQAAELSYKMKWCLHKDYRKLVFKGYIYKNRVKETYYCK